MGYKTAALALTDDSVGIDNPELMQEEKLAIILGTEGEGLMDRTIEMCDYTVKIPMSHDAPHKKCDLHPAISLPSGK